MGKSVSRSWSSRKIQIDPNNSIQSSKMCSEKVVVVVFSDYELSFSS